MPLLYACNVDFSRSRDLKASENVVAGTSFETIASCSLQELNSTEKYYADRKCKGDIFSYLHSSGARVLFLLVYLLLGERECKNQQEAILNGLQNNYC